MNPYEHDYLEIEIKFDESISIIIALLECINLLFSLLLEVDAAMFVDKLSSAFVRGTV